MMEYRGFGKSGGVASHAKVAEDANNALTFLASRTDVKSGRLMVLGQSYGGQLAIHVSNQQPELLDGLITEGTFTSFSDEAAFSSPWLVRPIIKGIFSEPYIAKQLIADITVPLLIVHSVEDKFVPFSMAKTLYASVNSHKQSWEVKGKHAAAMIDYP